MTRKAVPTARPSSKSQRGSTVLSRTVHRIDSATSRPAAAIVVTMLILLFGIALYRARVLPRWAAALLAVGGVASAALTLMPDAFYRLIAFPNGIAMVVLGYSLWKVARTAAETQQEAVEVPQRSTAGVE